MKRAARGIAVAVVVATLSGCASAPAPTSQYTPPAPELAAFLPDPTAGSDRQDAAVDTVRQAHARLLQTGDTATVKTSLSALLAARPEWVPARVALAQAHLVAGELSTALEAVRTLGPARGPAGDLIVARVLEEEGDVAGAAIALAHVQSSSESVIQSLRRLEPRAVEVLSARVEEAAARARYLDAEAALADLRFLRPQARRTLELDLELARATDDRARELELLRRLAPGREGSVEMRLRRADLEMQLGDAPAGLAIVQALATDAPGNAVLAEHLRRAQFRWRVINSPESVRRIASSPQIRRSDAAVLLYWLLPQVRTARGGEARIASDILDHPAREEIVRVVNLGLLAVDDTQHTFHPERAVRRSDLLAALLRVLARAPAGDPCTSSAPSGLSGPEAICQRAVTCTLVQSPADCLAGGPISGSEALELIRRTTERSEQR